MSRFTWPINSDRSEILNAGGRPHRLVTTLITRCQSTPRPAQPRPRATSTGCWVPRITEVTRRTLAIGTVPKTRGRSPIRRRDRRTSDPGRWSQARSVLGLEHSRMMLGSLWSRRGIALRSPPDHHENAMGSRRDQHGITTGCPWPRHEIGVESSWDRPGIIDRDTEELHSASRALGDRLSAPDSTCRHP